MKLDREQNVRLIVSLLCFVISARRYFYSSRRFLGSTRWNVSSFWRFTKLTRHLLSSTRRLVCLTLRLTSSTRRFCIVGRFGVSSSRRFDMAFPYFDSSTLVGYNSLQNTSSIFCFPAFWFPECQKIISKWTRLRCFERLPRENRSYFVKQSYGTKLFYWINFG